jgi:uncharacterized protein with PQ loop repeat
MDALTAPISLIAATPDLFEAFTRQLALIASVWGIVSSLAPTLQIVRMRRAGSSASLSRSYITIGAAGYMIWFAYGLAMHNTPLIVSDALGGAMQLAMLFWAVRLRNGRPATL